MTDEQYQQRQLKLLNDIDDKLGCLRFIVVAIVLGVIGLFIVGGCTVFMAIG